MPFDRDRPALSVAQLQARRSFLKSTAFSLAALAGTAALANMPAGLWTTRAARAETMTAGQSFVAVCDSSQTNLPAHDDGRVVVTDPAVMRILEEQSGRITTVDLPFFGHAVTQNPVRRNQAVTFEKWGRRGALVDIQDGRVLAPITAAEGNVFFGHVVFSQDGETLVTSEDNYARGGGQLVLRDARSMAVLGKKPSYGVKPHECRSPDGGRTVIVMNEGLNRLHKGQNETVGQTGPLGSIAWVDWDSGQLLNKIELSPDLHSGYSHLNISDDHWICVGGIVSRPSQAIALISPDGKLEVPDLPPELVARMKGEALSIEFLRGTGLVAISMPTANMIVLLDYKRRALVDTITLASVRGLVTTTDGDGKVRLLISSTRQNGLQEVVMPMSATTPVMANAEFGGRGSHMTRMVV